MCETHTFLYEEPGEDANRLLGERNLASLGTELALVDRSRRREEDVGE